MISEPRNAEDYVYLNLDVADITKPPAIELLGLAKEYGIGVKLGTTLLAHNSWIQMLRMATRFNLRIFADTKADDIPNTVEGTLTSIFRTHPEMINIHASSGETSLEKFMEIRQDTQPLAISQGAGSLALAVTVLTNKTDAEIRREYNGRTRLQQSRYYAHLAQDYDFDGITCSAKELKIFGRERKTRDLLKVVLGVRPEWAPANDQAYTITPEDAVRDGAYAVGIGRPFREPPPEISSPRNAIESVLEKIDTVIG